MLLAGHYNSQPAYREELGALLDCLDAYQDASEVAADCIESRFPPPQITYNRFMGELQQFNDAFIRMICRGADVIAVALRHTGKRDAVLRETIAAAGELADRVEELSLALVAGGNGPGGSSEEIDALVADISRLTDSVRHYR
jgi:hypothetical protein